MPKGSEREFAVQKLDLDLLSGETLCIVGESGSGKSLTARSVMGLLPAPHVCVDRGSIDFLGEEITSITDERLRDIRGNEISMIFQEPMTALNPVMTIGKQIDEIFRYHSKMSPKERVGKATQLLNDVHLPDPSRILSAYPHELSGGQRQRSMIAMALAMDPKILIADEPTTALDVTIQAQILLLLQELQADYDMGLILITHDLGVVARIATRVAVMYAGQVVEQGTAEQIFENPMHPYTRGLMRCIPVPGRTQPGEPLGSIPGMVPSLIGRFTGCRFADRCDLVKDACRKGDVPLRDAKGKTQGYRCVIEPRDMTKVA